MYLDYHRGGAGDWSKHVHGCITVDLTTLTTVNEPERHRCEVKEGRGGEGRGGEGRGGEGRGGEGRGGEGRGVKGR